MSYTDHLGNVYRSKTEMCNAYGIRLDTFNRRIKAGWTLGLALRPPCSKGSSKPIYDPISKKWFPSMMDLSRYYNISYSILTKHVYNGGDLQELLSQPREVIKDFDGNIFSSNKKMCEYYNISDGTYLSRIKSGWDKETALTFPVKEKVNVKDHMGNSFPSKKEMCIFYGINPSTFQKRLKNGMSVKNALLQPVKKTVSYLFNDTLYITKKEMCEANGLTVNAFSGRLLRGWSLGDALNIPILSSAKKCTDHLGKEYLSFKEMCENYKIPYSTYSVRIRLGWDQKTALETPVHNNSIVYEGIEYRSLRTLCKQIHSVVDYNTVRARIEDGWLLKDALFTKSNEKRIHHDYLGNSFSCLSKMCEFYSIHPDVYRGRIRLGWDLQTALTKTSKESYGEYLIEQELIKHGIPYKREYSGFKDRRYIYPLRDDFAIFKTHGDTGFSNVLCTIEFNGLQHIQPVRFGGMTQAQAEEVFEQTIKRDYHKKAYLEERGIPQLVIWYDQLSQIPDTIKTILTLINR